MSKVRICGTANDQPWMGDRPMQNTQSMDMRPTTPPDCVDLERSDDVRVLLAFSGDVFREAVNYPVIVESWDRVKANGRKRRKYQAVFTAQERRTLAGYYGKFYRWYLVSGTPKRVLCKSQTLNLLQRAVHFFATV